MLKSPPALAKTWTITVWIAWVLLWLAALAAGGGPDGDIIAFLLASAIKWSILPFLGGLFLGDRFLKRPIKNGDGAKMWIRVAWIFAAVGAMALALFMLGSAFPIGGYIFVFALPPFVLGGVAVLIQLWLIRRAQRFQDATEKDRILMREGRSLAVTWSITVWSTWLLQWFLLIKLGTQGESGLSAEVIKDAFAMTAIPAILGFLVVAFAIQRRTEQGRRGGIHGVGFGLVRVSLTVGILAIAALLLGRLEPGVLVVLFLILPPMIIGSLAVMIRLLRERNRLSH